MMNCELKVEDFKKFLIALIKSDKQKFVKFDNVVKFIYDGPLTDENKKLAIYNMAHLFNVVSIKDPKLFDSGKYAEMLRAANALADTKEFMDHVAKVYNFKKPETINENIILNKIEKLRSMSVIMQKDIDSILKDIKDYFNVTTFNSENDRQNLLTQYKQELLGVISEIKNQNPFANLVMAAFDSFNVITPYISIDEAVSQKAGFGTHLVTLKNGQKVEAIEEDGKFYAIDLENKRTLLNENDIKETREARLRDSRKTNNGKQVFENDIFDSGLTIRAVHSSDQNMLMNHLRTKGFNNVKVSVVRIGAAPDQRIARIKDLARQNNKYTALENRNHETWENEDQQAVLKSSNDGKILTISRPKASEQEFALVGEVDGMTFYIYSLENYVFVNSNNSTERVDFTNKKHQDSIKQTVLKRTVKGDPKSALVELNEADLQNLSNFQEHYKKFKDSVLKNLADDFSKSNTNSVNITEKFLEYFAFTQTSSISYDKMNKVVQDNMHGTRFDEHTVVTVDEAGNVIEGSNVTMKIPYLFTKNIIPLGGNEYKIIYVFNSILSKNQRILYNGKTYTDENFVKSEVNSDEVIKRIFSKEDEILIKNLQELKPGEKLPASVIRTYNFFLYPTVNFGERVYKYRIVTPSKLLTSSSGFANFIVGITSAMNNPDTKEALRNFNITNQSFALTSTYGNNSKLRISFDMNSAGNLILQIRPYGEGSMYTELITEENKRSFDFVISKDLLNKLSKSFTGEGDLVKKVLRDYPTLQKHNLKTAEGIDAFYTEIYSLSQGTSATENIKNLIEKIDDQLSVFTKQLIDEVINKIEPQTKGIPGFMEQFKKDYTFNGVYRPEFLLLRTEDSTGRLIPKIIKSAKSEKDTHLKNLTNYDMRSKVFSVGIITKANVAVSKETEKLITNVPKTETPKITEVKSEEEKPTNPPPPDPSTESDDDIIIVDPLSVETEPFDPATKKDIANQSQWLAEHLPQMQLNLNDLKNIVDLTKVDGNVLGAMKDMIVYLNSEMTGKGTLYHESFHGVFRFLMDSTRRRELIDRVVADKRYAKKFTNESLAEFARVRNYTLSIDDLIRLQAEEILADGFQNYMLNKTAPKGWLAQFFEMLKKIVQFFINNKDIIEQEYQNINTGYYKTAVVKSDIFKGQIAYELIPSLSEVYKGTDGSIKRLNENYLSVIEQNNLVRMIVSLMIQEGSMNTDTSPEKIKALFNTAVIKAKKEIYNLELYKNKYPEKYDAIVKKYGPLFTKYQFVMGAKMDGKEIFDINLTGLEKYDQKTYSKIIKLIDGTEIDNNKGAYSLEVLEKEVMKEYNKSTSVQLEMPAEFREMLEQVSQSENKATDTESGTREETESNDFDSALGEFDRVQTSVNQVRRYFSTVRQDYYDPELGISIPRIIDSEGVFSACMKILADVPPSEMMGVLKRQIKRAEINGYTQFAKDLEAVYNKIESETRLDKNGKPQLNSQLFNTVIDAFHGIELDYYMATMQSPKAVELDSSEAATMNAQNQTVKFISKDSINEKNNREKLRSLLSEMTRTHSGNARNKDYITSKNFLASLYTEKLKGDRLFTKEDKMENSRDLDILADQIHTNMQTIGLKIPKTMIILSLMAIESEENKNPLILEDRHLSLYEDEIMFVKEGKYLEKNFFYHLQRIIATQFYDGQGNPKPIAGYFDLSVSKKEDESLKFFMPTLRNVASYVIKYDPSELPTTARNAEGKQIYKFTKMNPLAIMAQEFRKLGLSEALSKDPYFNEYLKNFIKDNFLFKDLMNGEDTDKAKIAELFLKNMRVTLFGGLQQKIGDVYREGKTFKQLDERSLYAVSINEFMKREEIVDKDGRTITIYKRPFHQLESTNTNFFVTGLYEVYSDSEKGRVTVDMYGKKYPKIVESLEAKVRQEYERIKREWNNKAQRKADYEKGKNTLLLKFNAVHDENGNPVVDSKKLRAYQFRALDDFFKKNEELNTRFINFATEGVETDNGTRMFPSYDELSESDKRDLLDALEKHVNDEFSAHLDKLVTNGTIVRNLDKNTESKPEVYYSSEFIQDAVSITGASKKDQKYNRLYKGKKIVVGVTDSDVPGQKKTIKEVQGHVEELLYDFYCNHLANAMTVNEIFDGDMAMNVSDFTQYVKRLKRFAAAGSTLKDGTHKVAYINTLKMYINETFPMYGPYRNAAEIQNDPNVPQDLKQRLIDEMNNSNNWREIFDGQSISTIMHQMDLFDTLGRLDEASRKILIAKNFRELTRKEIDYLEKNKIVMNPKKTLTAARNTNNKQSEAYIDRNDVSALTKEKREDIVKTYEELQNLYTNIYELREQLKTADESEKESLIYQIKDNYVIIHSYYTPIREELHDLLNAMEFHMIDQLMDTTASKNVTLFPLDINKSKRDTHGYLSLNLSSIDLRNEDKYLQVETSGVKDLAKVSVQKKVLITSDLKDMEEYVKKTFEQNPELYSETEKAAILKAVKTIDSSLKDYQVSLTKGTKSRLLYLKSIFRKEGDFDIAMLYDMIRENLIDQGAPTNTVNLFMLDKNRKPIYSPNLPIIRDMLEFYFFKLYSKHVTDEKAFGFKSIHESSFGYDILEDTVTKEIITTEMIRNNPEQYQDRERYRRRPLGVTVVEENGVTKYMVEAIIPKPIFKNEDEERFWMEKMTRQFATRIPTEDKRSMVVLKIVDFVDSSKKNSIIVPHLVHLLAGSDFDIDSLFGQTFGYYKTLTGQYQLYGEYDTYVDKDSGEFFEFLDFMNKNEEIQTKIKNAKKEMREKDLQYDPDGIVHELVLAAGFTQEDIDMLFERAEIKSELADTKGKIEKLRVLKAEAKERFKKAIDQTEENDSDYEAWEMRKKFGKEVADHKKALNNEFNEKKKLYEELNDIDHKRLSDLINAFYTITATISVFNEINKYSTFKLPTSIEEFKKNKTAQELVSYKYQNDNLKASMDLISNEAVFKTLWINQRSSAEAFKKILNMFGITVEELAQKGSIFSIDNAIAAKIENAMNKDGIGITASLNKFLALCSQYQLSLTEKQVIWNYQTSDGKKVIKNVFGLENEDGDRTIKLIGIILGIFADGAKDPIPAALNLNEVNSGITLAMIGVGLRPEFAMGFNFIPSVKNAVKNVQKTRSALSDTAVAENLFFNTALDEELGKIATASVIDELQSAGLISEKSFPGVILEVNNENLIIDFTPKTLDKNKLKNNTLSISDIGFTVNSSYNTKQELSPQAQEAILVYLYMQQAKQGFLIRKATRLTDFFKSLDPSVTSFDKMSDGINEILGEDEDGNVYPDALFKSQDIQEKLLTEDRDQVWSVIQDIKRDLIDQAKLLFLERSDFFKPLTEMFKKEFENKKTVANVIANFVAIRRLLMTQPGSERKFPKNASAASIEAKTKMYEADDANLVKTFKADFWFTNDLGEQLNEMKLLYPDNEFLKVLEPVTNREKSIVVLDKDGKEVTLYQKYIKVSGLEKIKGTKLDAVSNDARILASKESLFVKQLLYHELARTGMNRKRESFIDFLPDYMLAPISKQLDDFGDIVKDSVSPGKAFDAADFYKKIGKFMNIDTQEGIEEFLGEIFFQIGYASTFEKSNSKIKSPSTISMFLGDEKKNLYPSAFISSLNKNKLEGKALRSFLESTSAEILSAVLRVDVPKGAKYELKSDNFKDGITISLIERPDIEGTTKGTMPAIAKKLGIRFDSRLKNYSFPMLYKIGDVTYMLQGVDRNKDKNIGKSFIEALKSGATSLTKNGFVAKYIPVPTSYGSSLSTAVGVTKEQAEQFEKMTSAKKKEVVKQEPTAVESVQKKEVLDFKTIPGLTIERKREILKNFATKFNITQNKAYEYVNQALNSEGANADEIIKKLNDCY